MISSNSNFSIFSFVKFVFKILFRQLIFHLTSQPQSSPLFIEFDYNWERIALREEDILGVNNCGSVNRGLMTQSKSHLFSSMKIWITITFWIVIQLLSLFALSQVNSCTNWVSIPCFENFSFLKHISAKSHLCSISPFFICIWIDFVFVFVFVFLLVLVYPVKHIFANRHLCSVYQTQEVCFVISAVHQNTQKVF